jgi:hypothetical protein
MHWAHSTPIWSRCVILHQKHQSTGICHPISTTNLDQKKQEPLLIWHKVPHLTLFIRGKHSWLPGYRLQIAYLTNLPAVNTPGYLFMPN